MLALTQAPDLRVAKALRWRPLVFFGDISYCMYCLHHPVLRWYRIVRTWAAAGSVRLPLPPQVELSAWEFIPWILLSWAASAAAYYYVETPTREPLAALLCRGLAVEPRGRPAASSKAKP